MIGLPLAIARGSSASDAASAPIRNAIATNAAKKKKPSISSRPSARARALSRIASWRRRRFSAAIASGLSPRSRARRIRASGRSGRAGHSGSSPFGPRCPAASSTGSVMMPSSADRRQRHRDVARMAERLGRQRQQAQRGEIGVGQLAQPVGAVQVGPFRLQHVQPLVRRADPGVQLPHLAGSRLGCGSSPGRPRSPRRRPRSRSARSSGPASTCPPSAPASPGRPAPPASPRRPFGARRAAWRFATAGFADALVLVRLDRLSWSIS